MISILVFCCFQLQDEKPDVTVTLANVFIADQGRSINFDLNVKKNAGTGFLQVKPRMGNTILQIDKANSGVFLTVTGNRKLFEIGSEQPTRIVAGTRFFKYENFGCAVTDRNGSEIQSVVEISEKAKAAIKKLSSGKSITKTLAARSSDFGNLRAAVKRLGKYKKVDSVKNEELKFVCYREKENPDGKRRYYFNVDLKLDKNNRKLTLNESFLKSVSVKGKTEKLITTSLLNGMKIPDLNSILDPTKQ